MPRSKLPVEKPAVIGRWRRNWRRMFILTIIILLDVGHMSRPSHLWLVYETSAFRTHKWNILRNMTCDVTCSTVFCSTVFRTVVTLAERSRQTAKKKTPQKLLPRKRTFWWSSRFLFFFFYWIVEILITHIFGYVITMSIMKSQQITKIEYLQQSTIRKR